MSNSAKRIGIIANLKKPNALLEIQRLCQWLTDKQCQVIVTDELKGFVPQPYQLTEIEKLHQDSDLIIVLGGDGTLLWGARKKAYGSCPVLGVNFGTLGFLVNTSVGELYHKLESILANEYECDNRIMMEASILRKAPDNDDLHTVWKQQALNDVVISRDTLSRIIKLRIHINQQLVNEYRADGLIISTPTGSTGHSLSAGGPIVYPTMDALIISPLCPHTLSNRPLIINGTDVVEIEIATPQNETYLTLDGQEGLHLQPHDRVIVQKSSQSIKLISTNRTYFQILQTKLNWGV